MTSGHNGQHSCPHLTESMNVSNEFVLMKICTRHDLQGTESDGALEFCFFDVAPTLRILQDTTVVVVLSYF
jgi:hypothetical protein